MSIFLHGALVYMICNVLDDLSFFSLFLLHISDNLLIFVVLNLVA